MSTTHQIILAAIGVGALNLAIWGLIALLWPISARRAPDSDEDQIVGDYPNIGERR